MGGRFLVRDTTDRGGVVVSIAPDTWYRFLPSPTRLTSPCPPMSGLERPGGSCSSLLMSLVVAGHRLDL
jgi:hypothetical protein